MVDIVEARRARLKISPDAPFCLKCGVNPMLTTPPGSPLRSCSKCAQAGVRQMYCSVECQKKDWPRHKGICGNGFAPALAFTRPPYIGKTAPTPRLQQQIFLLEKYGHLYDYFLLRDGQAPKAFILDDPFERGGFQRLRHMALSGGAVMDGQLSGYIDTLKPDGGTPELIEKLKQHGMPEWAIKSTYVKTMGSYLKESATAEGERLSEREWRDQLSDEYGVDPLGPARAGLETPSLRDRLRQ